MSETGPLAEAFVDVAFRLDRASEANLQRQVKATVSRLERSGAATIAPKAAAATTVGVSATAAPNLFTRLAQGGTVAQLATTGAVTAVRQLDQVAAEAAGGGVAELATTVSGADVALQRLGGRGAAASRSLTDLRTATSGAAGSAAAGAGVWALAAAAVAAQGLAAKKSVDAFIGGADAVREFSQRSGLAAEDASRFVAVIDDFGIASTGGANSLFFLGRAVNENATALERQGLRIARNKDGTADLQETFFNLADAIKSTDDPGRRFALIQATLGRQGRELIPVLEQGGDRLRELFADVPSGQIFSAQDLATTLAYQQAVDDVGDSVRELGIVLGREFVPILITVAKGAASAGRALGSFVELNLGPIRRINEAYERLVGNTRNLNDDLQTQADTAEMVNAAFEQLNEEAAGLLALVDAQVKSRDASFAVADANDRVAEAQEALNVVLARGGKFAEDEARANERLATTKARLVDLNRQLRDSGEEIADAEAEVAYAQLVSGRQSREVVEAERRLRDAREGRGDVERTIAETQREQRDAQKELTDAQKAGGAGSKEAADAQRDLERAVDAQEKTFRNVARAQAELEIAQRQANGETVTAIDLADEYQRKLVAVAQTLAPDSQLRRNIFDTATELAKLFKFDDVAGGGEFGLAPVPSLGGGALAPGAIPGGSLAPGAVSGGALGGNAVGVGALSGGVTIEYNLYNQQDPLALATDTAWLLTQRGAGSLLRAGAI